MRRDVRQVAGATHAATVSNAGFEIVRLRAAGLREVGATAAFAANLLRDKIHDFARFYLATRSSVTPAINATLSAPVAEPSTMIALPSLLLS